MIANNNIVLLTFLFVNLLINKEVSAQILKCSDLLRPSIEISTSEFLDVATFGPEFTFTNEKLVFESHSSAFPERQHVFLKVRRLLEKRCLIRTDCVISDGYDKHGGNFRLTYSDGWYFEIGIDNLVLEAQTRKGTYADFQKNEVRLKRDLFDLMKFIGLTPHSRQGGGHIHIGADVFHQDPVLFRNFFADYANFPQLNFGIFDSPNPNHPPIAVLKKYQQVGFAKALKDFDDIEKPELKNFSWLINSLVYTEPYTVEFGGPAYYQAIRLDRLFWLNGTNTVELRGFRSQRSVRDFLLEIEIIGARMDFLKKQGGRIAYRFADNAADFSDTEIIKSYYRYITESGLSWSKYKTLIPHHLQQISQFMDLPSSK